MSPWVVAFIKALPMRHVRLIDSYYMQSDEINQIQHDLNIINLNQIGHRRHTTVPTPGRDVGCPL